MLCPKWLTLLVTNNWSSKKTCVCVNNCALMQHVNHGLIPAVSASMCCTSPLPSLCHHTSSRLSRSTVGKSCFSAFGCLPTSDDSHIRSLHNGSTIVGHFKDSPKASSAVCNARVKGEVMIISGLGDNAGASTLASVACAFPSSVRRVSYLRGDRQTFPVHPEAPSAVAMRAAKHELE